MAGILEKNFMKVWLGTAAIIGYHLATDARAIAISQQIEKTGQLTIIYRRPFCPLGRVERFPTPDKLSQSSEDWQRDMLLISEDNSKKRQWVLPSPTGAHQIIYTHPTKGPLLGYYSRFFGTVVAPFGKINSK